MIVFVVFLCLASRLAPVPAIHASRLNRLVELGCWQHCTWRLTMRYQVRVPDGA